MTKTLIQQLNEAEGHVSQVNEKIDDVLEESFGQDYYNQIVDWGHDLYNGYYWLLLKDADVRLAREMLMKFANAIGIDRIHLMTEANGYNEVRRRNARVKWTFTVVGDKSIYFEV